MLFPPGWLSRSPCLQFLCDSLGLMTSVWFNEVIFSWFLLNSSSLLIWLAFLLCAQVLTPKTRSRGTSLSWGRPLFFHGFLPPAWKFSCTSHAVPARFADWTCRASFFFVLTSFASTPLSPIHSSFPSSHQTSGNSLELIQGLFPRTIFLTPTHGVLFPYLPWSSKNCKPLFYLRCWSVLFCCSTSSPVSSLWAMFSQPHLVFPPQSFWLDSLQSLTPPPRAVKLCYNWAMNDFKTSNEPHSPNNTPPSYSPHLLFIQWCLAAPGMVFIWTPVPKRGWSS